MLCTGALALSCDGELDGEYKHNPGCYEPRARPDQDDELYFPCNDESAPPDPSPTATGDAMQLTIMTHGAAICTITGWGWTTEDGKQFIEISNVECK